MNTTDQQKKAAGEAAAQLVADGMTLGLGTGSTAAHFVAAVGRRAATEGLKLRCVPTSSMTEAQARSLGLPIVTLDEAGVIDLTVDGADEIGPGLYMNKGGGAAQLRENLVWEASRGCVVIAEAAKRVEILGAFPLALEVVAFGHTTTARRIAEAASSAGVKVSPRWRIRDGAPVTTDTGQFIYDLDCIAIHDPVALATALKAVTGLIEHGLFLGLTNEALIGDSTGVTRLSRSS